MQVDYLRVIDDSLVWGNTWGNMPRDSIRSSTNSTLGNRPRIGSTVKDEGGPPDKIGTGMRLYVCWGTFSRDGRHACGNANEALIAAGHEPVVRKTYGCFRTDPLFSGRRDVKRITGTYKVPTLVLDDGDVIDGSQEIIAWARANPRNAHIS